MKTAILILALTTTVHAGDEERERGKTRGNYSYSYSYSSRETHTGTDTRESDDWTQDTMPHAVPEPSPPLTLLAAAASALIGRRHRKGCIRERRVDMRTVRFP